MPPKNRNRGGRSKSSKSADKSMKSADLTDVKADANILYDLKDDDITAGSQKPDDEVMVLCFSHE